MTVSVVIPTLNEAAALPATLAAIGPGAEVIVSDGGSSDATVALARAAGARVIEGTPGRGRQLAAGVAASSAEALVLVHADTWLPPNALAVVVNALGSREVAGGGFRKRFRDGPTLLRWGAAFRSRLFFRMTGCLFGDQAIFVRRTALDAADGMPDWPLMEDLELCRRLRTQGRLVLLPEEVRTSGRRFSERGLWRTWWRMGRVLAGHALGARPETLARLYRRR